MKQPKQKITTTNSSEKSIGPIDLKVFKSGYLIFKNRSFEKNDLFNLISKEYTIPDRREKSYNYYYEKESILVDVIDSLYINNINMERSKNNYESYPYYDSKKLVTKSESSINDIRNNSLYLTFTDIYDMDNKVNKRCNIALKFIFSLLDELDVEYDWIDCPCKRDNIIRFKEAL